MYLDLCMQLQLCLIIMMMAIKVQYNYDFSCIYVGDGVILYLDPIWLILLQILHLLNAAGLDILRRLPDDDQRSQGIR